MTASKKRGIQVSWQRGLLPMSLLIIFVLRFGLGAPIWVISVFLLWIPLFYIAMPLYVRRKWAQFDKDFARQFQKREYKALLLQYRDQWFLRKFGPQAEMLGKLGLIYSAMHQYREAEDALEKAIDHAHKAQRDKLYFNLAGVKYELGRYEDAEQILRSLRVSSPYGHSAKTQLALIDLRRGRRTDAAREFLEKKLTRSSGDIKIRIQRALAECWSGETRRACQVAPSTYIWPRPGAQPPDRGDAYPRRTPPKSRLYDTPHLIACAFLI